MSRWWLIPLLALFLVASLYQITLPGLHYDEAFEAVPAVQLLNQQPVQAFRNSTLTLLGTQFPLTTQDYIGALNTYGALPFLWLGGINVASLRIYAIIIGLVTLFLVYGFTADLTRNHGAGVAAVSLLVLNPTFVFWTRQGIFVTAITATIGVAAAWAWLRWHRNGQYRWALAGAFLFGLGIYAKLLFLWLIAACFGAYLLTLLLSRKLPDHFQTLRQTRNSLSQGVGLFFAGAFGAFPLIIYNFQTGGTFRNIGQNASTSYYGVDNTAVLSNLGTRFGELFTLLDGGHFWYLGGTHHNFIAPIIFGLAFLSAIWLAWRHRRPTALALFTLIGLVVIESIVTVSALWITHFALIMVFPAIAIAVTAAELVRARPTSTRLKPILALLLVLFVLGDSLTTWQYHQDLSVSGGLSDHSDAIYDMADWLNSHAEARPVVAMDWGLAASITFLTAGNVTPIEVFGYDFGDTSRFEAIIKPQLSAQHAIFLWRSPDEVIFDRSADFQQMYRPLNLEEDILEAFYERNGRPIYGATELTAIGAAKNKPQ